MLGQSWILPHQYQIFFLGVGLCGPCPISITTKICLDNTGSCPISITLNFCAWTIVDPAPSVSNIFFGCWIVWSVPHQYHDKNMLGQYWILPHQYHINFFVLGQSWILPHQYQIFFLGVGLCGPCPISITTKICLDNTGSCPISIT